MDTDKTFPTFKKIYKNIYENTINGNYPKATLGYCFRVLLFLVLCRGFIKNLVLQTLPTDILHNILLIFPVEDDLSFLLLICGIINFVYYYSIIKFCGLFKKINHLNFFIGLIIAILIDILYCYSNTITLQLSPFKMVFDNHFSIDFVVLPCFIIFKFFNFLSQKFPIPFKQIGYFFSIEFYKDLYKKIFMF